MNIYWEQKIRHFWLIISAASLLLPLTTFWGTEEGLAFDTVTIGILAVLFAFSLPFSILALPLMAMFRFGIELDLNSMFGTYFFIILLNAFGYLQWFWLIPKYFNHGKEFKLPTILREN